MTTYNDFRPEYSFNPDTPEKPFRVWCQKVLPAVYDDSLSYYELLNKVVVHLNQVIGNMNAVGEDVNELNKVYQALVQYMNSYKDYMNGEMNTLTENTESRLNAQDEILETRLNAQDDKLQEYMQKVTDEVEKIPGTVEEHMNSYVQTEEFKNAYGVVVDEKIGDLSTRIQANETNIETLQNKTEENKNNINELKTRVQPIELGGTGATTVEEAQVNLRIATNLNQLDGVLSIPFGGTGATTVEEAQVNLGIATKLQQLEGYTSIDGRISTNETNIALNAEQINKNSDDIKTLETDVADNKTEITVLKNEIQPIKRGGTGATTVKEAQANLGIATNLNQLEGYTDIDERIQANEANIELNAEQINKNSDNINELKTRVQPIELGGTGATTVEEAQVNLGIATNLNQLDGVLSIEKGGTGAESKEVALSNLGAFPVVGGVPILNNELDIVNTDKNVIAGLKNDGTSVSLYSSNTESAYSGTRELRLINPENSNDENSLVLINTETNKTYNVFNESNTGILAETINNLSNEGVIIMPGTVKSIQKVIVSLENPVTELPQIITKDTTINSVVPEKTVVFITGYLPDEATNINIYHGLTIPVDNIVSVLKDSETITTSMLAGIREGTDSYTTEIYVTIIEFN